ncbi:MAG: alpha/beta hydrolase [Gammaproteobacteria bacterium]|nr:alpha/beta hydrolase [Gammaproteobacteria bacterium]
MEREIPLYTLSGVNDAAISTHHFDTEDKLGLSLMRYYRDECKNVVVIIHGLTTSSDMFIMPEHENLVMFLLTHGFTDVWTFDFRMSNRHIYNLRPHRYSMDDCALYDHPAAIDLVRSVVGSDKKVHVICHCLGSVSFVMSLFAKKLTGVASVVANSVALTPRIPKWSLTKGKVFPFVLEYILDIPYVSPRWDDDPHWSRGKLIGKLVSLFHRECDVPACHMLSLMWGTGWPALYEHENLADVTHRRGGDLYGGTSLNYHRHVMMMVDNNNTAVRMYPDKAAHSSLPVNYFQYAAEVTTPVLFMTGANNRVFTDSNIVCYERLKELVPENPHELLKVEGYGHQDVFMGKNVAKDVFPKFMPFIEKHAA